MDTKKSRKSKIAQEKLHKEGMYKRENFVKID